MFLVSRNIEQVDSTDQDDSPDQIIDHIICSAVPAGWSVGRSQCLVSSPVWVSTDGSSLATPLLHPHNQLEQSADVQAAPPSQGRAGQLWALQQIFTFQPSNSQLYIENNFPAAPLPFKPWHQSTLRWGWRPPDPVRHSIWMLIQYLGCSNIIQGNRK